jgi:hypothetical protein
MLDTTPHTLDLMWTKMIKKKIWIYDVILYYESQIYELVVLYFNIFSKNTLDSIGNREQIFFSDEIAIKPSDPVRFSYP